MLSIQLIIKNKKQKTKTRYIFYFNLNILFNIIYIKNKYLKKEKTKIIFY